MGAGNLPARAGASILTWQSAAPLGEGFLVAPQVQDWISVFLSILVEATPFLLLGVMVSSLVHVFVSEDRLLRFVPRNPILSLVPALGMGMLMPVCECGNVAVARRFLAKGVPASACITFLLASPILNPVALFATATAFRGQPEMVWLRGGLAFLVASGVGLLIGQTSKGEQLLASGLLADRARASGHHHHGEAHRAELERSGWRATADKISQACSHAGVEFMTMMQVLVVGAAIASATQILIPRSAITGFGTGVLLGIVAMMSLAFVLSICSTVDAFFALSYANLFPMPALLAFLVFGPMLSMKNVAMLLTTFRPRVVAALVAVTVELIFLGALLLNLRGQIL